MTNLLHERYIQEFNDHFHIPKQPDHCPKKLEDYHPLVLLAFGARVFDHALENRAQLIQIFGERMRKSGPEAERQLAAAMWHTHGELPKETLKNSPRSWMLSRVGIF